MKTGSEALLANNLVVRLPARARPRPLSERDLDSGVCPLSIQGHPPAARARPSFFHMAVESLSSLFYIHVAPLSYDGRTGCLTGSGPSHSRVDLENEIEHACVTPLTFRRLYRRGNILWFNFSLIMK